MQTLTLHRDFLRKPLKGISSLMVVIVLAYIIIFATRTDTLVKISQNLSFIYLFRLVIGVILPEISSLFILAALINGYHQILNLKTIDVSFDSVARYELKFVPLFLFAFFFFFPITLHLRFFLREFPHYTLISYYDVYLFNGFSVNTYLFYLPFVFVLGYALVNISMFFDFSEKAHRTTDTLVETIENKYLIVDQDTEAIEVTKIEEVLQKPYLAIIEAKNTFGTMYLNVQDCYYFVLIGNHEYAVEHTDGRFKIDRPISTLEQELDPTHFFKCNRKTIINLNYTGSFVYLDKGKYNVCMKSPIEAEFDITRVRVEALKNALKVNVESK